MLKHPSNGVRGRVLVLVVLSCCGWLSAAEYFISNKPGSGAGTKDDPFGMADLPRAEDMRSEGAALSALHPGDTLTFLPGVYELRTSDQTVFGYIRPVRSGEAGKPITFRAQPGGEVVLRSVSGTQGVLGTVKIRGWQALDYIRFFGFVIEFHQAFDKQKNPELNGMRLQGRNNEVGWCRFVGQYLPTTNNFDGIRVERATNARIHHNEIVGWKGNHWNATGIKVYTSDNCIFEDNYIHGNQAGIYEKDAAAGNIYRRNYVTDNATVAFLGSNQTAKERADARYSVHDNVFIGRVNLLTLSRGIEFHNNLVLPPAGDGGRAGYMVHASGGRVYQTKVWNNVCITGRGEVVAYGLDHTRWSANPPSSPLAYCDHNVYDARPAYRFGRYSGGEDVFSLEQMREMGFERNSKVVSSAAEIYEDQTTYRLKPQWLKAGRDGDPVGPDDVAKILDTKRYGPSAMPASLDRE